MQTERAAAAGAPRSALVALDAASRQEVEAFLGRALGEPVDLGAVRLAAGRAGAAIAALARASAITLGNVICLDAAHGRRVRATPDRVLDALGSLLVHECVHVVQYRRDGSVPFLGSYLKKYFTSLIELRSIRSTARVNAYLAIEAEREAFAVERRWRLEQVPEPPVDDS